ncbi:MAG TPA: FAD-binding protein [Candidatus Binataceae bacterium]|nr:FAD-binding protein [Candidatus Binataceae bacterium]
MLNIAVLIKQIPLIEDANFDPTTKTIKRDGPNVISAFDLRAVSLAMELKNRHGAETTVITLGPPQARESLEQALAMGMDRAVHITDRAFAGSDTLATARALAETLRRAPFDLVLLGKYSLDAETGQVGPEIAELLGIAQITGVRKLEIDGRNIKAERESDEGFDEVEAAMPALLTCAERVAQPIKVKPDAAEQAKSKPIATVSMKELRANPEDFGLQGSPTWVAEIRAVETPVTKCHFIDAADPERAAADVIAELDKAGALQPRAHKKRAVAATIRKPLRGRDVWVVAETNLEGFVTRGTLELLSRADQLATHLGGSVVAAGFGASMRKHAGLLGRYGADRVVVLDSPDLAPYTPETAAEAMASVVKLHAPWGLFLSASERGRDWGPRLAARLGLGLTGDAIGLEIDEQNRLVALKPAFGGNIVAPILSRTLPQMATVRSGVLELADPNERRTAEVEVVHPHVSKPLSRLVKEHSLLDTTIEPMEGAEVIVGIGTGVGGPEGVAAVKDFARTLRAGMCATRRVTDAGWMPRQIQVGLTGKAIDPRLYFAVGIRGAINHTIGIKRAQTVVAINNDPEAQIFERADIGLVADWSKMIPALRDALQKRLA